ncbi:MAG: hypothetical protein U0531_06525 [Dehalococcoidia bacterium]
MIALRMTISMLPKALPSIRAATLSAPEASTTTSVIGTLISRAFASAAVSIWMAAASEIFGWLVTAGGV